MSVSEVSATGRSGARRYDLDWLRVIAFAILIFYHIGMLYVTWGWHVKSPHASAAFELPMLYVNPWRLALLFFISGVAVRFAADKTPLARFAGQRFARLAIPIVFGMAVIVAPQAYYELRFSGEVGPGFWAFYGAYLRFDSTFSIATPTWNHLWYVVYVLVYTMLLVPFMPLLRRFADGVGGRAIAALSGSGWGAWRLLFVFAVPFVIYRFALDPHFETTHNLVDDWANHAHRFTIFLLGYLVARNERFWGAVRDVLPVALGFVLASGVAFSFVWHEEVLIRLNEDHPALLNALRALRIVYAWGVIVALLGLAQRFANRSSPALSYLTEAIFPYYILHQTITVVTGYYLAQLSLPLWSEFLLLTSATVFGCILLHEYVIRRVVFLRPLFGLKIKSNVSGGLMRALASSKAG